MELLLQAAGVAICILLSYGFFPLIFFKAPTTPWGNFPGQAAGAVDIFI